MIGAVDESQGTIAQHAVGGGGGDGGAQLDDDDAAELVLFQVKECYVYMVIFYPISHPPTSGLQWVYIWLVVGWFVCQAAPDAILHEVIYWIG